MVATEVVQRNVGRLLQDAQSAADRGDPETARVLAHAVLALEPDNQQAQHLLSFEPAPYVEPINRRRYTRRPEVQVGEPLPVPGPVQELCETTLRRELRGFMSTTQTVWLETYSVGRDRRRMVYRSSVWKAGKNASVKYEAELNELVRTLVADGWQPLPGDHDGLPRFRR